MHQTEKPRPSSHWATRAIFAIAGTGMAVWAPLVPYAKERLHIDDATLGIVLFFLGGGSVAVMPFAGVTIGRFGSRRVILISALGMCLGIPVLALANSVVTLAAGLTFFGASMGLLDVAMNVHAVEVERSAGRPLLSGFHAFFSAGGALGSLVMIAILGAGLAPATAAGVFAIGLAGASVATAFGLAVRMGSPVGGPMFAIPHGIVVVLGMLCFAAFLAEGAMLDWSALFLVHVRNVETAFGGAGYAAFAVSMTVCRFFGDGVVHRLGRTNVIVVGGLLAVSGLSIAILIPSSTIAVFAFAITGIGLSNMVPVIFSIAGNQRVMPADHALAAVTALGYVGLLAGPAALGFIADVSSLSWSFAAVAVLLLMAAVAARFLDMKVGD